METLVDIRASENTACNQLTLSHWRVSCTLNLCNAMNNNIKNHLQPATTKPIQRKFYPTEANTIERLVIDSDIDEKLIMLAHKHGIELKKRLVLGASDEAVEVMRAIPIGQRKVSCFLKDPSDCPEQTQKEIILFDLLRANVPQVEALRKEPSWIEKKRMEDELPIFTPCCLLRYIPEHRTYYPINYTCLLDFEISQDDNPTINLDELKLELAELPQMAYCGKATNGIDLLGIVAISTPQRYAAHAMALIRQFKKCGVIIRVAESITHTRALSSDPNGYFNGNAVEFAMFWD